MAAPSGVQTLLDAGRAVDSRAPLCRPSPRVGGTWARHVPVGAPAAQWLAVPTHSMNLIKVVSLGRGSPGEPSVTHCRGLPQVDPPVRLIPGSDEHPSRHLYTRPPMGIPQRTALLRSDDFCLRSARS
jgi:hypothetical protein